jgi:hypothetical protein
VQHKLVAIHKLLCASILKLLDANEQNKVLLEPFKQSFITEFNQLY